MVRDNRSLGASSPICIWCWIPWQLARHVLVQPVSEHFQWCRKYYHLSSFLSRGSLRCLWTAMSDAKFLFTFNKNYAPWSFQFFIPVWNCRVTRNKSNDFCTQKLLVYLRGALKFHLSLLFYRFNIHNHFKEASSVILSIPFTILVSSALNVFHFVNISLKVWSFRLTNLDSTKWQAEYYHFHCSVLLSHSSFYMPISVTKIKRTSRQDDLWWLTLLTWLSIVRYWIYCQ